MDPATDPEAKQLTTKERVWLDAYLGEAKFNATKAAIAAGYSEKSARGQGSVMRAKPHIAARIREELQNRSLPKEAVLAELTDIAAADWRDFLIAVGWDQDGNPVRFKMDMTAKVKSLELIGKHYGLFTDKLNISGAITFADLHALAATEPGEADPQPGE